MECTIWSPRRQDGVQEDNDQMEPKYDKYEDEKKTIRMFWDSPSVSGFSDSIKGT